MAMTCPECGGEGLTMDHDAYGNIAESGCEACSGTGSITQYIDRDTVSAALENQTTDQIYQMLGKV